MPHMRRRPAFLPACCPCRAGYKRMASMRRTIGVSAVVQLAYICLRTLWHSIPFLTGGERHALSCSSSSKQRTGCMFCSSRHRFWAAQPSHPQSRVPCISMSPTVFPYLFSMQSRCMSMSRSPPNAFHPLHVGVHRMHATPLLTYWCSHAEPRLTLSTEYIFVAGVALFALRAWAFGFGKAHREKLWAIMTYSLGSALLVAEVRAVDAVGNPCCSRAAAALHCWWPRSALCTPCTAVAPCWYWRCHYCRSCGVNLRRQPLVVPPRPLTSFLTLPLRHSAPSSSTCTTSTPR